MLTALILASLTAAAAAPPAPAHAVQPAAAVTPPGFLQMFVAGVMPTSQGHTLVLVNPDEEILLPVGVDLPEALTIFGRLEQKTSPRPLTHDLLDKVVGALGAEVVRVQIGDLVDGVFIATVFLLKAKNAEPFALDARASDAVAVALSAQAPIFVSRGVVGRAAMTREDLKHLPSRAEPAPAPGKAFDL